MITVFEPPRSRNLTTVARVKSSMRLTSSAQDERIAELIAEASDAIVAYCGREFARASVSEGLEGSGRTVLMLSRTPIVSVSGARLDDVVIPVASYRVSDPEAGFLFRTVGWEQRNAQTPGVEYNDANMPGEPIWAVDYLGGYLTPDDNVTYSGSLSAQASDQSFNLSSDAFPLVAPGDFVVVTGFAEAVNNGRHRVVSRSLTKVIVTSALVDATASGVHGFACNTLPTDITRYATQEVVNRYKSEDRDDSLTAERIGDWQGTYRDVAKIPGASDIGSLGLSPKVSEGLRPWVRIS